MRQMICRIGVVLFVMGGLMGGIASAQSDALHVQMIGVEYATSYPDVTVDFRVTDSNKQGIADLGAADVLITENGQPISDLDIVPREDIPINVVFMIDLGYSSAFKYFGVDRLKQMMRALVDGGFRDGVDTVAIYARQNDAGASEQDSNVPLLAPTQSRDAFLQAVDTLTFSPPGTETRYSTYGLRGIREVVEDVSGTVDVNNLPLAVIYVGRMIEQPSQQSQSTDAAAKIVEDFANTFVRFYTFHADISNPNSSQGPFLALTGGNEEQYLRLTQGGDNLAAARDLFATIFDPAQRTSYQAHYQSTTYETRRNVMMTVRGQPAAGELVYEQAVAEPVISIDAPDTNFVISRNAVRNENEDRWEYDTDTIPVTATIQWQPPAAYAPAVERLELLVDGVMAVDIPNPEGTMLNFNWQIVGIEQNTSAALQVRLTDEYGRDFESSSVPGMVEVNVPDGVTEVIEVTEINMTSECELDSSSMACWRERTQLYLPWVGLVAMGGLVLVYRRKLGSVAVAAAHTFLETEIGQQISKTMVAIAGGRGDKHKTLARLEVLDGPSRLLGKQIDVFANNTTLGRDPGRSDIQVYDKNEQSTVSGRHCTLEHNAGRFTLTDDASSVGTYVNGIRLEPHMPFSLNDGDEIVLGEIGRRGARLRFSIEENDPASPAGTILTDEDMFFNDSLPPVYSDDPYANSFDETRVEPDFRPPAPHRNPSPPPNREDRRRRRKDDDDSWRKSLRN